MWHSTRQHCEFILRQYDADRNGGLDFEEFVRLFFEDRGAQHRGSSHHQFSISSTISGAGSRDKEQEADFFKVNGKEMKRQASARVTHSRSQHSTSS